MYYVGNKKQAIKEIQKFLHVISRTDSSIPRIAIDGIYGVETKNAVVKYQTSRQILPTGRVDKATFDCLYKEYKDIIIKKSINNYIITNNGFPLKRDMQNNDVMAVNLILNELKNTYKDIHRVNKSSYYDKNTENAVMDLQKIFSENVTGEVDKMLFDRLKQELKASQMSNNSYK